MGSMLLIFLSVAEKDTAEKPPRRDDDSLNPRSYARLLSPFLPLAHSSSSFLSGLKMTDNRAGRVRASHIKPADDTSGFRALEEARQGMPDDEARR